MTLVLRCLTLVWIMINDHISKSHAVINLRGAGASFPAAVYDQWIPFHKASRPEMDLNMPYEAIGSGGGKRRIKRESIPEVEYAGSDSTLKEAEYIAHPDLQMFPTMAGAVVIGYKLPGFAELTLSREAVVGVYNGSILWWNDTQIARDNPRSVMPAQPIRVLARADKSGTTEAFTRALSTFSADWNATFGAFSDGISAPNKPAKWKEGVMYFFGQTNRGMSGLLVSIQYTLGYISAADAAEMHIPTAKIINAAGHPVFANTSTVQAAMEAYADGFDSRMTLSLANAPGVKSYPIAAYTYLIVYKTTMRDCDSATALYRYVEWFLTNKRAAAIATDLSMVPMSQSVVNRIYTQVLDRLLCRGNLVKDFVVNEKYAEEIARQTWRMPVFIIVPIATVSIILMLVYTVLQHIRLNKAIFHQEYLIRPGKYNLLKKPSDIEKSDLTIGMSGPSIESSETTSTKGGDFAVLQWGLVKYCRYQGEVATLKPALFMLDVKLLRRSTKRMLLSMKDDVNHGNVVRFYGIVDIENRIHLADAFCHKGSLQDVVHGEKFNLDNVLKFSMVTDVANGMNFLHSLNIVHGYLTTNTCLIDSRWNVKIADWQLVSLCNSQGVARTNGPIEQLQDEKFDDSDRNVLANKMFCMAPELIADQTLAPTKYSDVYSFAIIVVEVFTGDVPFNEMFSIKEPKDIIMEVITNDLRPKLTDDIPSAMGILLTNAWSKHAMTRPPFSKLCKQIKTANPSKKSVLDCMMEELEHYVQHLEDKVRERTVELDDALQKMEALLHKILPPSVAKSLARGETVEPESFESVSIYFSDIVSFTTLAADSAPIEIVQLLNDLYTTFDDIIDNHDVYKVETIGDAYMCISGLPTRNGIQHASHIANMSIDITRAIGKFRIRHRPDHRLQIRIGVHSGAVVAGVVGVKMPRYCLFGDTVNTASRMETNSLANKIHLSASTRNLLHAIGGYKTRQRANVAIKGKGEMRTHWLLGQVGKLDDMPYETTKREPGDIDDDQSDQPTHPFSPTK